MYLWPTLSQAYNTNVPWPTLSQAYNTNVPWLTLSQAYKTTKDCTNFLIELVNYIIMSATL